MDRFGGPERLELREREDPIPAAGEVRVRVSAIGLNFADLFVRAGVYPRTPPPPMVPGMEVSGVVEAVGAGVSGLASGQPVAAVPIFGGHAEKVVCRASRVFALPAGADVVEAAALPVAFLTAHYALAAATVSTEDRVVVTAAAGGVGTALLQLLARRGSPCLALVGSPKKVDLCRALGASSAGLYAEAGELLDRGFQGQADVVIDAIGGSLFRPLWSRLAPGGRYALYGFAAAAGQRGLSRLRALRELVSMGAIVPFALISSCRTLIGFNLSLLPARVDALRQAADEIFRDWLAGIVRPVLGPTWGFEHLPDAHRALAGRETTGKILIRVGAS